MDSQNRVRCVISDTISDSLVLSGTSIYFGRNSPGSYLIDAAEDIWLKSFLKTLFESQVLKPEDFRDAVIVGVKRCGLAMHDQVSVRYRHPSCVDSPAALAYVLQCQALAPYQLAMIHRCLGDDFEQFKLKADGLIDNIMCQLRAL